jgi:tetratricopeptide (TPR) repeat protein
MQFKNIFIITKGTKVILLITFTVSLLAVLFAFFYYRNLNKSEDPRITRAREYLLQYDKAASGRTSLDWFPYLDSARAVFKSLPDYKASFEEGLIHNNKCSALLLMAIYDSTLNTAERSHLLSLSLAYCDSSIFIYSNWISEWACLSREETADKLRLLMKEDHPAFREMNFEKLFSRRVDNQLTATIETPRRLSVSLSNKGTIYRHMMKPDSALTCYRMALSLWKDNRTAANNLRVLLGGEPVKPTLIETLFPPDKNKK